MSGQLVLSADEIRKESARIPLFCAEIRTAIKDSLVNTEEAASILGCSHSYIQQCVKKGKMRPVRSFPKVEIFLKQEITSDRMDASAEDVFQYYSIIP